MPLLVLPCHAKVGNLNDIAFSHKTISRGEIPMNERLLFKIVHCGAHLHIHSTRHLVDGE